MLLEKSMAIVRSQKMQAYSKATKCICKHILLQEETVGLYQMLEMKKTTSNTREKLPAMPAL